MGIANSAFPSSSKEVNLSEKTSCSDEFFLATRLTKFMFIISTKLLFFFFYDSVAIYSKLLLRMINNLQFPFVSFFFFSIFLFFSLLAKGIFPFSTSLRSLLSSKS